LEKRFKITDINIKSDIIKKNILNNQVGLYFIHILSTHNCTAYLDNAFDINGRQIHDFVTTNRAKLKSALEIDYDPKLYIPEGGNRRKSEISKKRRSFKRKFMKKSKNRSKRIYQVKTNKRKRY
jgi:hypothetical protein